MNIVFKTGIMTLNGMEIKLPLEDFRFINFTLEPQYNAIRFDVKDLLLHFKTKATIDLLVADINGTLDVF